MIPLDDELLQLPVAVELNVKEIVIGVHLSVLTMQSISPIDQVQLLSPGDSGLLLGCLDDQARDHLPDDVVAVLNLPDGLREIRIERLEDADIFKVIKCRLVVLHLEDPLVRQGIAMRGRQHRVTYVVLPRLEVAHFRERK